jgi:hypothetical protein
VFIGTAFLCLLSGSIAAQGTSPEITRAIETLRSRKSEAISNAERTKALPLIKLSPADAAALLEPSADAEEDPCTIAKFIYFGQSIEGSLANTDCRLDDGSYADFYVFEGLKGEQIQIDMRAGSIDSYLGVANQSGTWVIEDDDSGGAPHARIIATLPESGLFLILANSYFPDQFCTYTLDLSGGPQCTFTFDPANGSPVSPNGGNFVVNVTTGPRCYWKASTRDMHVNVSGEGLGSGVVDLTVAPNPVNQERWASFSVRSLASWNGRQAPKVCVWNISPGSASLPATGGGGTIAVTGETGCFWSAQVQHIYFSASGSGNGSGTATYSGPHNNGADRSVTIRIGDQTQYSTFTVNQAGLNCTYSGSPQLTIRAPSVGYSGVYTVDTQPGCTWGINSSRDWIHLEAGQRSGPGSVPFTVDRNLGHSERYGSVFFGYLRGDQGSGSSSVSIAQNPKPQFMDFDGYSAEIGVFRPGSGDWWRLFSATNYTTYAVTQHGLGSDKIVPADYTGDGKTDMAVWRPETGVWHVLRSEDGSYYNLQWGGNGDIPVPGDYDGDAIADVAVFRPASGTWYIIQSSNLNVRIEGFGLSSDKPVVADYDGDGKDDLAIWRPGTGDWWLLRSRDGLIVMQFGTVGDKAAPADYTGDGKADVAIFRPSTGFWYILRSENFSYYGLQWGIAGDVPVPADYDNDGKTDPAVWRPEGGGWWILRSSFGFFYRQLGDPTDIPLASAYVRE